MPLLDVPFLKQFNDKACFAASAAMVLQYQGHSFNQRDLYHTARIDDKPPQKTKSQMEGCTEVGIMNFLGKKYRMIWWIDWQKKKLPGWQRKWFDEYLKEVHAAKKKKLIIEKKGAPISLIRKLIDKNKPVIAEVHTNTWLKTSKYPKHSTHDVVVTGYDSNHFFVNDPFNPYLKKKGKNF